MTVISGHQPVYLPWLGLLHKAAIADRFVFMDDVQYLRQDWNNRNKVRTPDGWQWLTVPVALKSSASEVMKDIVIAHEGADRKDFWQVQHFKTLRSNYARAAYWGDHVGWLEWFYLEHRWTRLAEMNRTMLEYLCEAFGITTDLVVASEVGFDGRKSDLVLDHARRLRADIMVTGALGRDYIVVDDFRRAGVRLHFQRFVHPEYAQAWRGFEPFMCAFDLLLNHGPRSREVLFEGNVTRDHLVTAAVAAPPGLLGEVGR